MPVDGTTMRLVAALLYAGVTAVLFAVSDPAQAGGLLFVLPIALLALSDGTRGGILGAAVATLLVLVWVLVDDIDLGVLGWLARLTAFVLIGALVGHYAQLARSLERRQMDERFATELHDRVLQSLVLATYRLERDHEARPAVDAALQGVKEIISERVAEAEAGDLRLSAPPPPDAGGPPGGA